MSTVDTAPPSSPLELKDVNPALFLMRDKEKVPASITVPGSSNFDLTLFNIIATGTVKPAGPGMLTLTLYGIAKGNAEQASENPDTWLPLASSTPEPIGGPGELEETMWMIAGVDLMIFAGSGKMQGCFKSNVANHPIAPIDLTQHPGDIKDTDPLYIFTVGASFVSTEPARSRGQQDDERGIRAEEPTLCSLTLASFIMDA